MSGETTKTRSIIGAHVDTDKWFHPSNHVAGSTVAGTSDHHNQPVYNKIGVSTRAGAALWAMQHAVVH